MFTSRDIHASPEAVYELLADYWRRPALLPPSFTDYGIKRGGHGDGTVVRYRLHVAGRVHDCRMEVTEPSAGRELLEADTNSTMRTRWVVEPRPPAGCRVAVETSWTDASGIGGRLERLLAAHRLQRIYNQALDQIARQAHHPSPS